MVLEDNEVVTGGDDKKVVIKNTKHFLTGNENQNVDEDEKLLEEQNEIRQNTNYDQRVLNTKMFNFLTSALQYSYQNKGFWFKECRNMDQRKNSKLDLSCCLYVLNIR